MLAKEGTVRKQDFYDFVELEEIDDLSIELSTYDPDYD